MRTWCMIATLLIVTWKCLQTRIADIPQAFVRGEPEGEVAHGRGQDRSRTEHRTAGMAPADRNTPGTRCARERDNRRLPGLSPLFQREEGKEWIVIRCAPRCVIVRQRQRKVGVDVQDLDPDEVLVQSRCDP